MDVPPPPADPSGSTVSLGALRLMRKRRPEQVPVRPSSIALFRLGEQCNNRCPMCSNSGRPEAFFIAADELSRRAHWLRDLGMRRVVVTGGEPTIHPAFWDVVAELGELGIVWDINTHGRRFSEPGFAAQAVAEGLERAIVSLHSHRVGASCVVSGIKPKGHHETVEGIEALLAAGAEVMVNFVLTTHTHAHVTEFLEWVAETYGPLGDARPAGRGALSVKLAFPSTTGKGGGWDGIALRYRDVQDELRRAMAGAEALGLPLHFESVPACVLDDPTHANLGRSGFGETHYLDDVTGDALYSIRHIEAVLSCYPETCRGCAAIKRCPGVAEGYARAHGADALREELTPFSAV